MHYKQVKGILSSKNQMNIYRGCTHGCIYCDSRSTCYRIDHDFEDIEIKENALELLEKALISKRKKCMIGTGSMCDPYIPLEENIRYTRRSLELIDKLFTHKNAVMLFMSSKDIYVLQDEYERRLEEKK